MRCLARNRKTISYMLYQGKVPILDENGFETGEMKVSYSDPVTVKMNVSPDKGISQIEQFGSDLAYNKVLITDDMTCPIDEHTVLFVEKEPTFDENDEPEFDYVVRRVAKSLTNIAYAINKVAGE